MAPRGAAARALGWTAAGVITGVDGVPVTDADQLEVLSVTRSPGDEVRLTGDSADAARRLTARPPPTR